MKKKYKQIQIRFSEDEFVLFKNMINTKNSEKTINKTIKKILFLHGHEVKKHGFYKEMKNDIFYAFNKVFYLRMSAFYKYN